MILESFYVREKGQNKEINRKIVFILFDIGLPCKGWLCAIMCKIALFFILEPLKNTFCKIIAFLRDKNMLSLCKFIRSTKA